MSINEKEKEQVYDTQIAPLIDQIVAICEQHRIPMLTCFGLRELRHEGKGPNACMLAKSVIMGGDFPAPAPMMKALMAIEESEPMGLAQLLAQAEIGGTA